MSILDFQRFIRSEDAASRLIHRYRFGGDRPPVPDVIKALVAEVNGNSEAMRQRLEHWFDDSMERVSGWYKRRAQVWLFVIGGSIALCLNADTIAIVRQLATDRTVRSAVAKRVDAIASDPKDTSLASVRTHLRSGIDTLQAAGIKFGWDAGCAPQNGLVAVLGRPQPPRVCPSVSRSLLGILITVVALSLGAPFWFDALNNIANLRQSGVPPTPTK